MTMDLGTVTANYYPNYIYSISSSPPSRCPNCGQCSTCGRTNEDGEARLTSGYAFYGKCGHCGYCSDCGRA